MKIAVYVDSFGNAADIFGQGHIEVFEKHAGCWHRHQQQAFDVNESMNLDEIRNCAFNLSETLADCRVLILKSIPGVLQAFFEGCGFKLWKMYFLNLGEGSFMALTHLYSIKKFPDYHHASAPQDYT